MSMLDYVLVSETSVKVIDQFLVDEEGWFDVGSDHNLIFWSFRKEKEGLESRKKRKKNKKDWRWNTKGNADWESYKAKIETKMTMFALEMVDQRKEGKWTAEMRFKSLLSIGRKLQKNHWENLYVGREKEKHTVGGMKR